MSTPEESDDEMPAEIDFSGGERGKFYRPNARLNLPAYPEGKESTQVPANPREPGELGK